MNTNTVWLILLFTLSCVFGQTTTYNITTIAGGGIGENGPAVAAFLYEPTSVAIGLKGELYIADSYRIRKIENNIITTIVGSAKKGFSGDGGLAIQATVSYPTSMVVGTRGEVLFVDDSRIRKVENGFITTIAGTGKSGYGGDGGLAINAQLEQTPSAVAINSAGEIFIVDKFNHRVRKIALNGTINTIAGTGVPGFSGEGGLAVNAQLNYPSGIAISSEGEIYIADTYNYRIRIIGLNGNITTLSFPSNIKFLQLSSVSIASTGELYIVDIGDSRIYKVLNGTISTVAGNGVPGFSGDGGLATEAQLKRPKGIAISSIGEVYVADTENYRIRRILLNGNITTCAGSGFGKGGSVGDGGLAVDALLLFPLSVATGPNSEIFIVDTLNQRIRKILLNGTISTIAGTGEIGNSGDGGLAIKARLNSPGDMIIDSRGVIYFSDTENHRIRKITTDGIITTIIGTGEQGSNGDGGLASKSQLDRPYGIAFNSNGELFIVEMNGAKIRKVDVNGIITTIAGSTLASGGTYELGHLANKTILNSPVRIAINSNNEIFVSDAFSSKVLKIGTDGIVNNIGYNFQVPIGMAIGPNDAVYVADWGLSNILSIDKKGVVSTIVTGLEVPQGIALGSNGTIYVTEKYDLRKITFFQEPSPYFSSLPATSTKPTPAISNKPTPILSLKPALSISNPTNPKQSERVSGTPLVASLGWFFTVIFFISVFQF